MMYKLFNIVYCNKYIIKYGNKVSISQFIIYLVIGHVRKKKKDRRIM